MRLFPANRAIVLSLLVVVIMLFSSAFAVGNMFGTQQSTTYSNPVEKATVVMENNVVFQLDQERFISVPVAPLSVDKSISKGYNGSISVLITFSLNNQSRLNSLLSNLTNPESSAYHKYITRSEFAENFSVSPILYGQAESYLSQYPGLKVRTYADRVSIEVTGPAREIGDLFNTSIVTNGSKDSLYFANSMPELPKSLAPYVSEVTGLSNVPMPLQYNMASKKIQASQTKAKSPVNTYPQPVNSSGVQYIYGSDLQVAYDEQSLLNITYPTSEVIATILWAGTNGSGTPVGAFDPSDIYAYYNATLPSYEPHAKVYGVPINGAVKPGLSATYDTTGANCENTLDLEMVGSTAPGASIYNVYGPNSTYLSIDSAFAFILNPNSTYKALDNVSVITNSWGGTDNNNTTWFDYLQEAQARGISVLASSGDSCDNTASSKYVGSTVEFPSAMAYDNFGVTAVGGDTLTLASNLHILNETAWYETSAYTNGSPYGSTGGISSVFKEPIWQLDTEANNLINGRGRGVPDISAIANNTIVYITINGTSYYGNPYLAVFGGTSVASPVEAGIIAEINAVLKHYNQSNLGYLNPLLYSLGNSQITTMKNTTYTGFIKTGKYNSTLAVLPFYNVMYGHNDLYKATYGYNLVTGWGSIDAYNLSMYVLNVNRSLSTVGLKGVADNLNLSGLNVTSFFYNSTTGTYNIVNTAYNASIQQNLFLADQLGAPIYWIQNVVYISGSQSSGWSVSYTGWVVFPFFGQYPTQTVYEYNFPLGETIFTPHNFDIKTWISNLTEPMQQNINFEINSHIISLPVPGAAYIIDANNYTYSWQGDTYYNGPYPDNPFHGGLNPQFGLVGGPSGGLGVFGKSTAASVSAYVEPLDMNSYIPATTNVFNESIDETGETSYSLGFTNINQSSWTISVNSGSQLQGIVDCAQGEYTQIFQEKGLPAGTSWSVNVSGTVYKTTSNQIVVPLVNGSYFATFSEPSGFFASPSKYIFIVSGHSTYLNVTYSYLSNETYIKPVSTIYPVNSHIFTGYTLNITYFSQNLLSFGMAYDNNSGMLFIPEYSSSTGRSGIYVYNTITSQFAGIIGLPSYDAIYNPFTGYIYALSVNGNISEINPTTFTILKNLTLTESISNDSVLQERGGYLYALSMNGYISQIDAYSMTIVNTVDALPGGFTSQFSLFFAAYDGNAYIANLKGNSMLIVNLTTSAITDLHLPLNYNPISVINYYGPELLISGKNYSDQLYNLSSGSLFTGPNVSGVATSSVCDQLSHTVFLFSSSYNLNSLGNITDVNPVTGGIISTIPGFLLIFSPMFDLSNQNIYADFAQGTVLDYSVQHYYAVNFTETGLPSRTIWYVNMSNGIYSGPLTGTSYSLLLANGTYSYTIATSNRTYSPSQSTSTVNVNGKTVLVYIAFSQVTYKIAFTESGLLPGSTWYVNLTNEMNSGPITGSSYLFSLSNGSYSYKIATSNRTYYPEHSSGTFTVNGSKLSEPVVFLEITYVVSYTETGLPAGTSWYVNITGEPSSGPISGSTYTLSLPNGTYYYSIATADKDYSPNPYSGTFTVYGSPVSVPLITFSLEVYMLTFTESGLPSGTWYINLSNGDQGTAIGNSSILFSLPNGSYSYNVSTSNEMYHPLSNSGIVAMSGNTHVLILFVQTTYNVKFTESGLPYGTTWYVNLTNGTNSGPITDSTYSFSMLNGSYSYTVATSNKAYSPEPSSGSFTVNGTPLSNFIAFSPVNYTVTFTETGLPSGFVWYVNNTGLSGHDSSQSVISFNLTNGTYSFVATNLTSYYTTTMHFSVVINGRNISEVVDYFHWAYITGTISPTNANLVINGKSFSLTSSGSYNISVPNGTYHVVISSPGYITYYSNFSLNPGNAKNLIIDLQKETSPPILSGNVMYEIVGLVIVIVVIGAVVALARRRK